VRVNDRDFRSDASGVAIPYGIYDLLANRGSVFVGVSHDTAALPSTPSGWWKRDGADLIATAAAGSCSYWPTGGSNSCRTGAWKTELQNQLCNSFGLTVTVAHYPAGASRWNPIEHRLFSEISKNWAAEPLHSYPKILNFIRNTCTRTGLPSRLTSTSGIIQPAPYPIQSRSAVLPSNGIRLCQPGIIRLLRCESIVASALSGIV
jgi:Rhodopirellula transposase DDE domain